jgi:hypothetical protein
VIRFVRNKKTGMFWDGREWVADISKAQDIPNGFAALDTACQHGLADAEYVVQPGELPSPQHDVRVDLPLR